MDSVTIISTLLVLILLTLVVLMCRQESKRKEISFGVALLLCIITTPIIGYLIISNRPRRYKKPCVWCGNDANEADYCGLCGKNEDGLTRESLL